MPKKTQLHLSTTCAALLTPPSSKRYFRMFSAARLVQRLDPYQRYVGVTGLAAIVRDHPKYAQEHQMAVIDCLEDPDETLKRKTLDLLYTMTNPVNVEFIADKLLSFLEQGTDSFWRQVRVMRMIRRSP